MLHVPRSLLALALTLLALAVGHAATAEPPQGFPKLAVIRLDEVLRSAKVCVAAVDANKRAMAEVEDYIERLKSDVERLENALKALNTSHAKYAETREALELADFRYKQANKRAQGVLDRRVVGNLRDVMVILRAQLKDFCLERGILRVDQLAPAELRDTNISDAMLQLGLQCVLYADPSLDITDAFVGFSNARPVALPATAASAMSGVAPAPTASAPASR